MTKAIGPLVLIDGHNSFIRNFVRSPYMNAHGERAGGTVGMVVSVRKIINDFGASNCLVVWDGEGGSQRRKAIYSNYKAGRTVRMNKREDDMAETPEEQLANLRKQVADAKEYLSLLGVPQVRCDGVEADDVMAYVAGKMDHPNGCIMVTTDQDMLQLIREKSQQHTEECELRYTQMQPHGALSVPLDLTGYDLNSPLMTRYATTKLRKDYYGLVRICDCPSSSEVRVYSPVKKVMYDRKTFISDYSGVLPENWRLVKALTGDSSDNIEGVRGFGLKTVVKSFPFLLERRATADEVMAAANGLKGVAGKRLVEDESRFRENLTLMDLSEPMLSATAARQARDALRHDLGCREVEFRVRVVRDGVSFTGDNFVGPFRDHVIRRRWLLGELYGKTEESDDGETQE
jgi:5'-3' exonuclease